MKTFQCQRIDACRREIATDDGAKSWRREAVLSVNAFHAPRRSLPTT